MGDSSSVRPAWTAAQLATIERSAEMRISVARPDGTSPRSVLVWAVVTDDQVYVRTWYRRDTGWYGRAVASRRAHVEVGDLSLDVLVEDVGHDVARRPGIDTAYRAKYGAGVKRMIGDDAAASTLRLVRQG